MRPGSQQSVCAVLNQLVELFASIASLSRTGFDLGVLLDAQGILPIRGEALLRLLEYISPQFPVNTCPHRLALHHHQQTRPHPVGNPPCQTPPTEVDVSSIQRKLGAPRRQSAGRLGRSNHGCSSRFPT